MAVIQCYKTSQRIAAANCQSGRRMFFCSKFYKILRTPSLLYKYL